MQVLAGLSRKLALAIISPVPTRLRRLARSVLDCVSGSWRKRASEPCRFPILRLAASKGETGSCSALVGCEAAVFVGCCPELVGVCLGVHELELFFQEPVGARARGDQGLESAAAAFAFCAARIRANWFSLLVSGNKRLDESEHAFSSKSLAISSRCRTESRSPSWPGQESEQRVWKQCSHPPTPQNSCPRIGPAHWMC
jgi:hypothetical protein